MEIYLLRHGDAEPPIFNTEEEDYERRLTELGEETLRYEALGLKNFVDTFDYILASPYTRTVQTAEVFAEVFECQDRIVKTMSLKPPASAEALLEEIEGLGDVERVLCVGHTPSIGEIASEIITSMEEEDFFQFRKGAILRFDMDYPDSGLDAKLVYYLDPDIIKFIGEMTVKFHEESDIAKATPMSSMDMDMDMDMEAETGALQQSEKPEEKEEFEMDDESADNTEKM
jgi:phosphohistidine phosphatase